MQYNTGWPFHGIPVASQSLYLYIFNGAAASTLTICINF